MFSLQTQPAASERLPLRPSPGPELLPEPPPGFSWEGLVLVLALMGLVALLWRIWRGRQPPAPSPQQTALAALERTATQIGNNPVAAFVETADILRRYWTATGQASAETLTTAEVLSILELPAEVDRDQLLQALTRADQLKFAGISVTADEAQQWGERVKVLLSVPPREQKTAPE
jgi:hypothetical protein